MENIKTQRQHIFKFLIFTFIFSWIVMGYIIYRGGIEKNAFLAILAMWVPGSVSLIYRFSKKIGFNDIGLKIGHMKYWALAIMTPLLIAAISYSISWKFGISEFKSLSDETLKKNGASSLPQLFIMMYPIFFLFNCTAALGEELGWRGFLIPKLYTAGVKNPLFLSSLIWGIWHYPLILWGGYATSDLPLVSLILFTIMIVTSGIFTGWLRMVSGSMWVAVAYHAAHNLFLQAAFEMFNKPGLNSQYLGGESGVIPCLVNITVIGLGSLLFLKSKDKILV